MIKNLLKVASKAKPNIL